MSSSLITSSLSFLSLLPRPGITRETRVSQPPKERRGEMGKEKEEDGGESYIF
jgi:hypothetical protein